VVGGKHECVAAGSSRGPPPLDHGSSILVEVGVVVDVSRAA